MAANSVARVLTFAGLLCFAAGCAPSQAAPPDGTAKSKAPAAAPARPEAQATAKGEASQAAVPSKNIDPLDWPTWRGPEQMGVASVSAQLPLSTGAVPGFKLAFGTQRVLVLPTVEPRKKKSG